jgi:hypothetical protein
VTDTFDRIRRHSSITHRTYLALQAEFSALTEGAAVLFPLTAAFGVLGREKAQKGAKE